MSDFRDNLRNYIEDKGYMKSAIAKKANISPSKLSAILHKNIKLDADEMFNLCNALETDLNNIKNYKSEVS